MEYNSFKDRLRSFVPDFILKPFFSLLKTVLVSFRKAFMSFNGNDNEAAFSYVHQRMQDSMSEIMD